MWLSVGPGPKAAFSMVSGEGERVMITHEHVFAYVQAHPGMSADRLTAAISRNARYHLNILEKAGVVRIDCRNPDHDRKKGKLYFAASCPRCRGNLVCSPGPQWTMDVQCLMCGRSLGELIQGGGK